MGEGKGALVTSGGGGERERETHSAFNTAFETIRGPSQRRSPALKRMSYQIPRWQKSAGRCLSGCVREPSAFSIVLLVALSWLYE